MKSRRQEKGFSKEKKSKKMSQNHIIARQRNAPMMRKWESQSANVTFKFSYDVGLCFQPLFLSKRPFTLFPHALAPRAYAQLLLSLLSLSPLLFFFAVSFFENLSDKERSVKKKKKTIRVKYSLDRRENGLV